MSRNLGENPLFGVRSDGCERSQCRRVQLGRGGQGGSAALVEGFQEEANLLE